MIKATFSTNPRVVEIQKSLLALWARREAPFGILALTTGIEAERIQDIATGKVEPSDSEIIILEASRA